MWTLNSNRVDLFIVPWNTSLFFFGLLANGNLSSSTLECENCHISSFSINEQVLSLITFLKDLQEILPPSFWGLSPILEKCQGLGDLHIVKTCGWRRWNTIKFTTKINRFSRFYLGSHGPFSSGDFCGHARGTAGCNPHPWKLPPLKATPHQHTILL